MNRGWPLTRRTPLVARSVLKRTVLVAKAAPKKRVRSTGPHRDVVDLIYERAQYACELCGGPVGERRGVDHHLHHRRPRRAGGSRAADTNSPANLLLLCLPCHEVVETMRSEAYDGGWLLHDRQDPAAAPVLIGAERWVLLTADGRYEPVREVA